MNGTDASWGCQRRRRPTISTTLSPLPLPDFLDLVASPVGAAGLSAAVGTPLVVVDLRDPGVPAEASRAAEAAERVAGLPVVIVGLRPDGPAGTPPTVADLVDVVVADPGPVAGAVEANPQAAVTLALVLRAGAPPGASGPGASGPVAAGLAAESAAYSMLQSGPEFARWRAARPAGSTRKVGTIPTLRGGSGGAGGGPSASGDGNGGGGGDGGGAGDGDGPQVVMERAGDELRVTLSRPGRHNAVNAALQAQLVEALLVACADSSIGRVVLDGAGPSFCSGGDLAEFGTFPDPATAHLVRLTRSPARLLAELGPRLEARIHGHCIGAGIEMAAFAGRVVAHPDTTICLPEVRLGLIPGAGGTVSLPRRIGRHRTAELALGGSPVDAATALRWGLVDAVEP